MDDTDRRAEVILQGVVYRARKRYRDGNFSNPFGVPALQKNACKKGMAMKYAIEMENLINSRICPCCGQPTRGDIDY